MSISTRLQNSLSFSRDIVRNARIERIIHARASQEARKERFSASLPNPTRNFHARSRSFSVHVQPDSCAKIRTVLQSTYLVHTAIHYSGSLRSGGLVSAQIILVHCCAFSSEMFHM